jgi:ATP-dependent Clp protease ATP-binding subunit ClpA
LLYFVSVRFKSFLTKKKKKFLRIINQDGIQILDIKSALKDLTDTLQQLQQYSVNDTNPATYSNPPSEDAKTDPSLSTETNNSTNMILEHFLTLGCQQMKQYILQKVSTVHGNRYHHTHISYNLSPLDTNEK